MDQLVRVQLAQGNGPIVLTMIELVDPDAADIGTAMPLQQAIAQSPLPGSSENWIEIVGNIREFQEEWLHPRITSVSIYCNSVLTGFRLLKTKLASVIIHSCSALEDIDAPCAASLVVNKCPVLTRIVAWSFDDVETPGYNDHELGIHPSSLEVVSCHRLLRIDVAAPIDNSAAAAAVVDHSMDFQRFQPREIEVTDCPLLRWLPRAVADSRVYDPIYVGPNCPSVPMPHIHPSSGLTLQDLHRVIFEPGREPGRRRHALFVPPGRNRDTYQVQRGVYVTRTSYSGEFQIIYNGTQEEWIRRAWQELRASLAYAETSTAVKSMQRRVSQQEMRYLPTEMWRHIHIFVRPFDQPHPSPDPQYYGTLE